MVDYGCFHPQVADLWLWKLLPFRQRQTYYLKNQSIFFDQYVYFSDFSGLKSQIFITVEFILRKEPIPAHLPERQNNSCIENLFFIKLRYEGCNGSKKYRISFIQFVLIWIELSVTKNFQQSIISNNYLSFNLFSRDVACYVSTNSRY